MTLPVCGGGQPQFWENFPKIQLKNNGLFSQNEAVNPGVSELRRPIAQLQCHAGLLCFWENFPKKGG
jgi:hypothetical protein